MKEQISFRLAQQCRIASAAASVFSAAVGLSGLAGSAFRIRLFVTWGVEPVTMKVNTAACFLLASFSLWLQREETQTSHTRRLAGRIGAALLGLIALLSCLEFFLDRSLRIDQLLIPALPDSAIYALRPGLMSPITAFNFLIFAVALLAHRLANKEPGLACTVPLCAGGARRFLRSSRVVSSAPRHFCHAGGANRCVLCRPDVRDRVRARQLGDWRASHISEPGSTVDAPRRAHRFGCPDFLRLADLETPADERTLYLGAGQRDCCLGGRPARRLHDRVDCSPC